MLFTFWLRHVLGATSASTFSTSQSPKVVRTHCVFNMLTLKCALRHNGVHFSTSQPPKVLRTWCALHILTSKCASRHNGVHFLIISTAKSDSELKCFDYVHFEMCFVSQWPALFQHLNCEKWLGVLTIFTSKCASRHSGVQLLISHFILSSDRSPVWSSFFFSALLWLFPPQLLHLSILSEVWLLNFLRLLNRIINSKWM